MLKLSNKTIIIATFIGLFLIAMFTVPHDVLDATDVKDYTDTAKFFAGDYAARYRGSHSVIYGLLLSPYENIMGSYSLVKLSSAFFLCLLILSIYYLSGKDRRTLLLLAFCPLIWYMAPWVSPIPLVSILFLWAYHFTMKFEKENKIRNLLYAGILLGLSASLWATALYWSAIFLICFLYDKKLWNSFMFILGVAIGFAPVMITDQILFSFPFYSLVKHISSSTLFAIQGGIYNQGYSEGLMHRIFVLIFTPLYFFMLFKKNYFSRYKKEMIFLGLSLIYVLSNPQARLLLPMLPLIIIILGKTLSEKQLRRQIIVFAVLSLIALAPYIAQFNYNSSLRYISPTLFSEGWSISYPHESLIIKNDLQSIVYDHPNEIFLAGNYNDAYRDLAHYYYGKSVREFVSIEDYNLHIKNQSTIASRKISSKSTIASRREIWFEAGIDKSTSHESNYSEIRYAISFDNHIDAPGFRIVKKYDKLYLFAKN